MPRKLFVGGPLDGKVRDVHTEQVKVPMQQPWREWDDTRDWVLEVGVYTRITYGPYDGGLVDVMLFQGTPRSAVWPAIIRAGGLELR